MVEETIMIVLRPLARLLVLAVLAISPAAAQEGIVLPKPLVDEPSAAAVETAVVAGGCFWGVQGVFQHVDGVSNAVSGYAGGEAKTATYEMVSTGKTGHAEAVKITFDPRKISYGQILQIFFSAHDPTQLNRQGPDVGTEYRTAIFPQNDAQARVAKAYVAQLDAARLYKAKVVTTVEPDRPFYPAEDYHQDFLVRNPMHPYIVFHDLPKLANLKRLFPTFYRDKPALVSAAKS
jgi:peptide-methionine (S)-S-oxide reductase